MRTLSLLIFMLISAQVLAQTPPDASAVPAAVAAAAKVEEARLRELNAPFRESFLFDPLEIAAIQKAAVGRPPGGAMLTADESQFIPPRRVIQISGVVFRKQDDWIVWLNGQKVIPRQLLPEIVDIKVANDIVHLKWFDIGMNKIISISLRPHQTYDIVTGLLLPG